MHFHRVYLPARAMIRKKYAEFQPLLRIRDERRAARRVCRIQIGRSPLCRSVIRRVIRRAR